MYQSLRVEARNYVDMIRVYVEMIRFCVEMIRFSLRRDDSGLRGDDAALGVWGQGLHLPLGRALRVPQQPLPDTTVRFSLYPKEVLGDTRVYGPEIRTTALFGNM